ncbi:aspartyl/asparaginyl beta-hydroxylase domain-containing protein [Afipia sp. P52-10]|uniref:aspartyl/asparaginyl beta-hydroxylase domain-containing protein n=1 Tax=Afipia sp. P52-10 TaxID=1429916 RepID=UPI0004B80B16|nr:aspartyl/asparaginyl beta-hydroxylase domain-containing protein [Afipia sp. P52-10]
MAQNSSVRASSATPAQPFANENTPLQEHVPPVRAPSAIMRQFMNAVQWAERKNRAAAVHGNPSVYDSRIFPWAADLESGWTIIRGELARLMMRREALVGQSPASSATIGEDRGWTTFMLANYFKQYEHNIAQCPETWRLVQKVPGLVSAMFSVLEPGRRLPPHRGPYNGLLRLHLGLIVPEPREAVAIRVDGKVHHWDEGRALIFDDTYEHEARNESDYTRVVLFVDFEKPLKFPARIVNRRLLRSYFFSPFVREGADHQGWWARRYYRQALAMRAIARPSAARPAAPSQRKPLPNELPALERLRSERPKAEPAKGERPRIEPSADERASVQPADLVEVLNREWPFDRDKT